MKSSWPRELWSDVRFALRTLKHSRVFAAAAITSISLGIGANTAVFSLIDTLVLRPLQVRAPRQLVRIGSLESNGMTMPVPGPILDYLRRDPLLGGVCGFTAGDEPVTFRNGSAVVSTLSVTGDCFETLGIRPALGRLLIPSDDQPNGPHVAVIGYRFWRDRLGLQRDVLGTTIKISGASSNRRRDGIAV
ncbi:MAG: ABC transporter permease [Acidobacteriaceae bacterium]|nr:ABC transporter permease [Acidobacteriaceae bacterium]MBV9500108.1 ABC transporter permease [Acidobacteriaceae bacterium]